MVQIVQHFAADVRNHFEVHGPGDLFAKLRGLIVKRKNAGRAVFLSLLDVTGEIQVLLLAENFSEADFVGRCKSLRKGDIISVSGPVEKSRATETVSVLPERPPTVVPIDAENTFELDQVPYLASGSKIIQARIVQGIERSMRSMGFLEISPKFLSTGWDGNGLEPLRAEFPGFGHNVYIVPSPLPQLFEALISTGNRAFFATSKCFTTSYRDIHSSSEATSVFAIERASDDVVLRDTTAVPRTALKCLKDLFSRTGTALPEVSQWFAENAIYYSEGGWPNNAWNGSGVGVLSVSNPRIPKRFADDDGSTLGQVEIEKYCRIVVNRENLRYLLAESIRETRFGALRVITTTIHTEHLLSLFSTAPFRSLRTSTFWSD